MHTYNPGDKVIITDVCGDWDYDDSGSHWSIGQVVTIVKLDRAGGLPLKRIKHYTYKVLGYHAENSEEGVWYVRERNIKPSIDTKTPWKYDD